MTERYHIVDTEERLTALAETLSGAGEIALDLETTSLDYIDGEIVGWSLAVKPEEAYYVPVRHNRGQNLNPDLVVATLKPILEAAKLIIIHNAKFDTRFLRNDGIDIIDPAKTLDSLLEAYAAAEGGERFGLKELEERLFKVKPITFKSMFPSGTKNPNIANIEIPVAGYYAAADSDYCLRIHRRYQQRLLSEGIRFIFKIEQQLWPIVQRIEELGVEVDAEYLKRMAAYLRHEAAKVERVVIEQASVAAGRPLSFSISSHKQLCEVLFETLGLPSEVRTKTGAPSTDERALKQLEYRYPICRNILTYRSMLTNASAMEGWTKKISPHDGRIHTSYNQAGATSGRFSSTDPNVQNIGKTKAWIVTLPTGQTYTVTVNPRDAFRARDGAYFVELDFEAIEFIIFAALAGQDDVVKAYERHVDVHKLTAADVLGKPFNEVTDEERTLAKTVNYATLYGASARRLSEETGKSLQYCQNFLDKFFRSRPKFLQFMQRTRDAAAKTKRVQTLFGRDQVVPEFFEATNQARSKADRASVNRRIQGTAADVQKMAIIRTVKRLAQLYVEALARMILQTHDSQTWENDRSVPPDQIIPQLLESMGKQLPGLPLIRVDAKIGVTWGSMIKYDPEKNLQQYGTWENLFDTLDRERQERVDAMPATDSYEDVQAYVAVDSDPTTLAWATSGAELEAAPVQIVFTPGQPFTVESLRFLKDVLRAFPGKNVVCMYVQDQQIIMRHMPTSLSAPDLQEALLPMFPHGRANVDVTSLVAAIVG